MAGFSRHTGLLDAAVDTHCGDSIFYKRSTDADYGEIMGRVFPEEPEIGFRQQDSAVGGYKLRVAKSVVAAPDKGDRFRCPDVLGLGTYRPTNRSDDETGRYWICDIQRVEVG